MNFSFPLARPVSRTGVQRYALFSNFQTFFELFSKFCFSEENRVSLGKNSQPCWPPVFQMGVQRYDFLFNFQIYFKQQTVTKGLKQHFYERKYLKNSDVR